MKRQRGVAAITAILIVAVAAAAATTMLAQQSAMIDQAGMVSARAQADQYAQAGIDWARGVLAADGREADSHADGWAQPIAALPVDRALVAGAIADEQGKLNLNNLVAGQASAPDVALFRRLLLSLQLAPELADAVVDWIDADFDLSGNGGAEDPFYQSLARPYSAANRALVQVEELHRVRGFDARSVARLKPYVAALPARTAINVNTAPGLVLAALLAVEPGKVEGLVRERTAKPFARKADFASRVAALGASAAAEHDVTSAYFIVAVRVAQDDVRLATEALVNRNKDTGAVGVIWRRPVY